MIDQKRAEDIVRANKCVCTPESVCMGKDCVYYVEKKVSKKISEIIGKDTWDSCDVDRLGFDSADMISALLEENDRLSDTIMTLRIMMRGDCGVCLHRHGGIGKEPCASCIDTDERGAWQLEGDEEHGQPKPGV